MHLIESLAVLNKSFIALIHSCLCPENRIILSEPSLLLLLLFLLAIMSLLSDVRLGFA